MRTTPTLISAAQLGDGDALAELYRLNQPTVYRYVLSRVRDADLAEDLTQETFLRAYRKLGSFEWAGRAFAAWLTTIARNLICDHYKSSRVRCETPVGETVWIEWATEPSAEDLAVEALSSAVVRAALSSLCPQWREVLLLWHWSGMTDRQIGAVTGRTAGAVKSMRHRASDRLRSRLDSIS